MADRGEALGLHELGAGALDRSDHRLEVGGELADLVLRGDDLARGEIALADGPHALGDLRERGEDAARVEEHAEAHAERERDERGEVLHAAALAGLREGGELLHALLDLRLEGAEARGTGLGLAVTREIIEAHGGHISCERRAEGGTRFRIWLPRANVEGESRGAD